MSSVQELARDWATDCSEQQTELPIIITAQKTWWEISLPWLIGILPPCGKINIVLKCKECGWAASTLISNYEWMKNQSVSVLPILWKKPEWTLKVLRQLCFALHPWHLCCLKQTVHPSQCTKTIWFTFLLIQAEIKRFRRNAPYDLCTIFQILWSHMHSD